MALNSSMNAYSGKIKEEDIKKDEEDCNLYDSIFRKRFNVSADEFILLRFPCCVGNSRVCDGNGSKL